MAALARDARRRVEGTRAWAEEASGRSPALARVVAVAERDRARFGGAAGRSGRVPAVPLAPALHPAPGRGRRDGVEGPRRRRPGGRRPGLQGQLAAVIEDGASQRGWWIAIVVGLAGDALCGPRRRAGPPRQPRGLGRAPGARSPQRAGLRGARGDRHRPHRPGTAVRRGTVAIGGGRRHRHPRHGRRLLRAVAPGLRAPPPPRCAARGTRPRRAAGRGGRAGPPGVHDLRSSPPRPSARPPSTGRSAPRSRFCCGSSSWPGSWWRAAVLNAELASRRRPRH